MKQQILLFLIGIFPLGLFGQSIHSIPGLKVKHSKLYSQQTEQVEICGMMAEVESYALGSELELQMSCNIGNPAANIYETVESQYLVQITPDPDGRFFRAILEEVATYWKEKEDDDKKYGGDGHFYLTYMDKGMLKVGKGHLPFTEVSNTSDGFYSIFRWRGMIYRVEMVESDGMGALGNFFEENLRLKKRMRRYRWKHFVEENDEVKALLSSFRKGELPIL